MSLMAAEAPAPPAGPLVATSRVRVPVLCAGSCHVCGFWLRKTAHVTVIRTRDSFPHTRQPPAHEWAGGKVGVGGRQWAERGSAGPSHVQPTQWAERGLPGGEEEGCQSARAVSAPGTVGRAYSTGGITLTRTGRPHAVIAASVSFTADSTSAGSSERSIAPLVFT